MKIVSSITVAIPYYQGLNYLYDAVNSVLIQDIQPVEIIICDDSPNGEAQVCENKWPGIIRYLRNPVRLGIVGNWNRCMDEVRSAHMVLLNADDMLLPGYFNRMLQAVMTYPSVTILFCEAITINTKSNCIFSLTDWSKRFLWPYGSQKEQLIQGDYGLESLMRGDYIMCPSVCYNVEKLNGERFNMRWNMVLDLDFFSRLLLEGHVFLGIKDTYFAFRRHPNNHTKSMEKDLTRFIEDVICRLNVAHKAEQLGWHATARMARKAPFVKLNYLYIMVGLVMTLQMRAAWHMLYSWRRVFTLSVADSQ